MSDLPSWAVRDAKVVCVAIAVLTDGPDIVKYPEMGSTYTIADIDVWRGGWYVSLREFPDFAYFEVRGFRPLVTLEDDIKAHFSQHLHAPQKIVERAS